MSELAQFLVSLPIGFATGWLIASIMRRARERKQRRMAEMFLRRIAEYENKSKTAQGD